MSHLLDQAMRLVAQLRLRDTPDLWVHREVHGMLSGASTIRDLPIKLLKESGWSRARGYGTVYQEVSRDTGLRPR